VTTTFVVQHIPHIIAAVIALAFLVRMGVMMLQQPPAELSDEEVERWHQARRERAYARRVRRGASRLALWSLVPLLYALASGLWLYTEALRNARPSDALTWSHSAAAVVGLGLATWKLAGLGAATLRRCLDVRRALTDGASGLLAVLGLPLLVTGAVLLVVPSSSSWTAYAHLVVSVWWIVLFGMHLMRYLGRALDAALRDRAAPERPAAPASERTAGQTPGASVPHA